MDKLSYDGPIVLAILDGVGLAPDGPGNAVSKARTAFLGRAARDYLHLALNASGEAVGLVAGQMGNSEVGHNTMGAGRAIKQGIAHIEEAFASGEVFKSEAWKGAINRVRGAGNIDNSDETWYNKNTDQHTLHFAGIFSDGGVHSHISHLEQMVQKAYDEGIRHEALPHDARSRHGHDPGVLSALRAPVCALRRDRGSGSWGNGTVCEI